MAFQLRFSEAALADFGEILAYSRANFPDSTERFATALLNHLELLKTFPRIGRPIAKRANVRQLVHTPVSVYYALDESAKVVEILHFWHLSRKPPKL